MTSSLLLPPFIEILGLELPLYGIFLSLAHFLGFGLLLFQGRKMGHPANDLIDLAFFVAIAGLVGARLGYFLEQPQELSSVKDFFRLDHGGLSFFFGFAFAFPAYCLVLRRKKISILPFSDGITVVLPASLAILKVGCYSSGCCYGTETHLPWGISLITPTGSLAVAEQNLNSVVRIHPVQLYESFFLIICSVVALLIWNKKRFQAGRLLKSLLPPGTLASGFLFFYAGFRLLTAPIRGDLTISNALGFPSVYATGSLLLVCSLVSVIYFSARKAS